MTAKNLSTQDIKVALKSALKSTKHARRVTRIKSYLKEVETASKKKAPIKSTKVGTLVAAFQTANKKKSINVETMTDFFKVRILGHSGKSSSAVRLTEMNLKFMKADIGGLKTKEARA